MTFKNLFHLTILVLLLFFGFWAFDANARTLEDASMRKRHEQWMAQHGKAYKDHHEKELRYKIFKQNVKRIEEFNNGGSKSHKLGVNQFADLTNEEFRAGNGIMGQMWSNKLRTSTFKYENVSKVPVTLDWRQKGAVTPVKNQGEFCGSCWAFTAVAAIEGITKLSTGKLMSLSEQELVDCDRKGGNQGCNSGYIDEAFKFVVQNKGLVTEASYPYQAADGTCNAKVESQHAASIKGYEDVPVNNETALLIAVANQPVSAVVDSDDIRFYSSGVFSGPCGTKYNHGVTIVGYGISENGTKYWLAKNSWGAQWGEQGYIRLQRDIPAKEGMCGIAMLPSYPIA